MIFIPAAVCALSLSEVYVNISLVVTSRVYVSIVFFCNILVETTSYSP